MKFRLPLLIIASLAMAPSAHAGGARLCPAALAYIDQAPPQAVFHLWDRPENFECDADQAASSAFCGAIIAEVPLNRLDLYPARLAACLESRGARLSTRTAGRKSHRRITGFIAWLPSGKTVTLRFRPERQGMRHGRYDLSVGAAPR